MLCDRLEMDMDKETFIATGQTVVWSMRIYHRCRALTMITKRNHGNTAIRC